MLFFGALLFIPQASFERLVQVRRGLPQREYPCTDSVALAAYCPLLVPFWLCSFI